jgi:hypothetical protein
MHFYHFPPEFVRAPGQKGLLPGGRGTHARQRWCFYKVRVPHPERSWIATMRLTGEELDEADRALAGYAFDSMMAAPPCAAV